jgi:hypothetical protein
MSEDLLLQFMHEAAEEHATPLIMDVSDLAQMMPKLFADKNILKGYKHCISFLGRLRWPRRCKQMQQNIIN